MKLHLPITLLTVLLCTVAAQAVEIPDGYEQIALQVPSQLYAYSSNTATAKYAFILSTDVSVTPTTNTAWTSSTPLITGGNHIFSTAEGYAPAALSFSGGQSIVFKQTSSLTFDTLSNLTISNQTGGMTGGAIYSTGTVNIINNTTVTINENRATHPTYSSGSSSQGGAVYSTGTVNIYSNTAAVTFSGNLAGSGYSSSDSYGGAIYSTGTVNINNNTADVTFSGNRASANTNATAYGGAIYSTGTINLNNNNDVTFSGNYSATSSSTSASSPSNAYGGAIYSTGSININNNSDVSFSGNYISYTSPSLYLTYTLGSAIYSKSGSITIEGNDSVTFEKNYIKRASTYKLQSIHMAPTASNDNLVLAAKTGGHITFNDSVYMEYSSLNPTVRLNADYLDANGVTQKAEGTIVFSGKYTEEHLKELKGATAISATEIDNSRTSQLLNTVNLYGGTLSVEDKAVLKTHAINVVAGSNATMIVKDAQVDTTGSTDYDITVSNSGALIITGSNGSTRIIAGNINIQEGASLSLTHTEVATENVPMTLAAVDGLSVYNDKIGGIVSGNLNLSGGATYIANGAHLGMDDGTLTFLASAENKTNLVLTLGAQYEKDAQILLFSNVDKAIFGLDNITMKPFMDSVTLQASDYFTGEWINDETTLVYDDGNIYVSGVNVVIPEPTTATLSLLALAGLAARRRRK